MSISSVSAAIIKASPYLARMSLSLMWMYITLDWRVKKTRKAFERQLTLQGMSKDDAIKLSACYEELKNNIVNVIKGGIGGTLIQQLGN